MDLCFQNAGSEVCAEKTCVNSATTLAVQRQTSQSEVVNWAKQHGGFMSWFLVLVVLGAKGGQGPGCRFQR